MIAKKSSKADLERKRFAFFQIGLIVAGSLTLAAFEYSTVQEEEKVVAVHDDGLPTYIFTEPLVDEVVERPEPRQSNQEQSALQMVPDQEVTIVKHTLNPNTVYTNQFVNVTEPCTDCYGIGEIEGPEDGEIEDWVDTEPKFPGGDAAMGEFIRENVNANLISEMGLSGVVYVEFVVNTDGSICQVVTKNDAHKDLKAEAERVVKKMPNWIPGEQAGKKVRVRYVVPINFVAR